MIRIISKRGSSGLTVIELLVAMTISALVAGLILELFLLFVNLPRRRAGLWEFADISVAMDALTAELQQASRQPDGVVIWERSTEGIRHDALAVLSSRVQSRNGEPVQASGPRWSRWKYFMHDPIRQELRRSERPSDQPPSLPSETGVVLARNVRSFAVVRRGGLLEVTLEAVEGSQTLRLQTAIWPRND